MISGLGLRRERAEDLEQTSKLDCVEIEKACKGHVIE